MCNVDAMSKRKLCALLAGGLHDVKGFLPSRQLRRHHISSVFDDDANLYTFH